MRGLSLSRVRGTPTHAFCANTPPHKRAFKGRLHVCHPNLDTAGEKKRKAQVQSRTQRSLHALCNPQRPAQRTLASRSIFRGTPKARHRRLALSVPLLASRSRKATRCLTPEEKRWASARAPACIRGVHPSMLQRRAEAVSGEFNSQAIANTLWAFATVGRQPGERMMRQLERRAEAISRDFNSLQLGQKNHLCISCDLKEGPIRLCLPRHDAAGGADGASVREHDSGTASYMGKNDSTHVCRRRLLVTCPSGLHSQMALHPSCL
jgi:hypothetical protein